MMQVELVHDGHQGDRYPVRAIGLLAGGSVLVTAPLRNGKLVPVRDGQLAVVRSFTRNRVLAFSTQVLRSCVHPYPYLHLKFPAQTQDVAVRKSRRTEVLLPALARVESESGVLAESVAAVVADLSGTGAMLESSEPLGEAGTRLRVVLKLPLDDLGEQELALEGKVRSHRVREPESTHCHGVEFSALQPMQALTLRAYLFGQLLAA